MLSTDIMKWNIEALKQLVVGCFLGDGWFDPTGGSIYVSVNFNLISQMSTILGMCNIKNNIAYHNKAKNGKNDCFKVSIPRGPSERILRDLVRPYLRDKDMDYPSDEDTRKKHTLPIGIVYPLIKIEKIQFKGFVYNISVEEDESYIVNNVTVHNCQDFRYRFAYYNNKAGITPIGSTAINKNNGQAPNLPDARVGACCHILALSEYLKTSIEAPKEPEPTNVPTISSISVNKPEVKPTITKTTSNAPTPEVPHEIEPKINPPTKREIPIKPIKPVVKPQKNPDKVGDTYSDTDREELKEATGTSLSQKFETFIKSHPQFEVKY